MAGKKRESQEIVKVVYFDQETASDYLDIVAGGNLSTTKEDIRNRTKEAHADVDAKISARLSWLPFLRGSADLGAGAEASIAGESILSKTLANTILTDYLKSAGEDARIRKLDGYSVFAAQNSMAFMKIYTPFMIAARTEDADFDIARMDEALEKAKGYYELLGENDNGEKVILRFNIRAFRNNYSLSDLTRMNLVFHGIEVGRTTEASLNIESEMAQGATGTPKLVDLVPDSMQAGLGSRVDIGLPVFDVVLAAVEGKAAE
ncbi:DUF6414 family protein [Corynebacterium sp. MSK218]|uniref:DUF6414 family protein n=1 Tax=Corynebacterium sp. MSK218 TaxID=3050218 RepID=UPI00254AAF5F|nr:DUF6414 family protein [Corynebacterium sp. MSK218]MDK8764494.1 DUF6414 family protein [Corynebacterium sp. MSK218]